MKQNAALIRKRIRSPRVKVRGLKAGIRSNTNVYLVYVEDLANPGLVKEIEKRLQDFTIDGILDSGMLEQLAEKKWYSPFPQFQTTQRPDRAAMAVLEGRVIVMCDNSPIGLILPTDYNHLSVPVTIITAVLRLRRSGGSCGISHPFLQ